jgi:hypothetical protein
MDIIKLNILWLFGRMPLLLGSLKLDTPVFARQPKVKHLHGYARD